MRVRLSQRALMKIPQYCLVTATKPVGWQFPTRSTKEWKDKTAEDKAQDRLFSAWHMIDREFKCLTTLDSAQKIHNSIAQAKSCVTKLKKFGLQASYVELQVTTGIQGKLDV